MTAKNSEFTRITNKVVQKKLIYPKLSYRLQGCFFKVYNTLGFGHKEVVYQRALEEEMNGRRIPFEKEVRLPVTYSGKTIAKYQPDFVVAGKIIVEVKAVEYLPQKVLTQLVYYLKGTQFKLGYLVNFGAPKLQIIRRVWSKEYVRLKN